MRGNVSTIRPKRKLIVRILFWNTVWENHFVEVTMYKEHAFWYRFFNISERSNGLPTRYWCWSRGTIDETLLRKSLLISTAPRGAENILGKVKIKIRSNSTHMMCNGNELREPQVIAKNKKSGSLLCLDEGEQIFTGFHFKRDRNFTLKW